MCSHINHVKKCSTDSNISKRYRKSTCWMWKQREKQKIRIKICINTYCDCFLNNHHGSTVQAECNRAEYIAFPRRRSLYMYVAWCASFRWYKFSSPKCRLSVTVCGICVIIAFVVATSQIHATIFCGSSAQCVCGCVCVCVSQGIENIAFMHNYSNLARKKVVISVRKRRKHTYMQAPGIVDSI